MMSSSGRNLFSARMKGPDGAIEYQFLKGEEVLASGRAARIRDVEQLFNDFKVKFSSYKAGPIAEPTHRLIEVDRWPITAPDGAIFIWRMDANASARDYERVGRIWRDVWAREGRTPSPPLIMIQEGMDITEAHDEALRAIGLMRIPADAGS